MPLELLVGFPLGLFIAAFLIEWSREDEETVVVW